MPLNVFTIAGEIKADMSAFDKSLRDAENKLRDTSKAIETTDRNATELGQTSNTTARSFDRFRESLAQSQTKLNQASDAFRKGAINSREMASALNQTGSAAARMDSKLKDTAARMQDLAAAGNKAKSSFGGSIGNSFLGNLGADALANSVQEIKQLAIEGIKLNASFDKLVRMTARLDSTFQSSGAIAKMKTDFQQLSTEIPHSADEIAKASFTLKSAFQGLTETDLVAYLKEFGNAATVSGVSIDEHASNIAALAKQYNIGKDGLREFSALITSAFGTALASDADVAKGFNDVLNAAKSTKQPLNDLTAAMSTLQSATGNAAQNTTLLENVYSKLTDGKYQEGFKAIGISVFDAEGNFRSLNSIIKDVAKTIEGLSDQQINEKFDFLKDARAREGFLTLARYAKEYNKQLAAGGDTQAFANNNKLMLDATENRWKLFSANIQNIQREAGGKLTQSFFEIADQPSFAAAAGDIANKFIAGLLKSLADGAKVIDQYFVGFWSTVLEGAGVISPTTGAAWMKSIDDFFADITGGIRRNQDDMTVAMKQSQIKSFSEIFNSPQATTEMKNSAKKSIDLLNQQLSQISNTIGKDSRLNEAGKEWAASLGTGIQTGAFVAVPKAQEAGTNIGNAVVTGANTSLATGRQTVQETANNLLPQLNPTQFFQVGFVPGQNVGQGLVAGINSQRQQVAIAANGLAMVAAAQISNALVTKSPSKVTTQIGVWVGEGLIIGMKNTFNDVKETAGNLAKQAIGEIKKQLTDFKKQLKDLNKENDTTVQGYGATFDARNAIANAEEFKSALEEIIKKRRELGQSLAVPLPANLTDANAELKNFARLQENADKLKNSVGDLFNKIDEILPKKDSIKELLELFGNPAATKLIEEAAIVRGKTIEQLKEMLIIAQRIAAIKELAAGAGKDVLPDFNPPAVSDPRVQVYDLEVDEKKYTGWTLIIDQLRERLKLLREDLPSIQDELTDVFLNLPEKFGDIFANAVSQWDGTLQGFFKSLAQGFKQMIQEIITQIIRLAVIKLVANIMSSFGGGAGGGSAPGNSSGITPGGGGIGGIGGRGVAGGIGGSLRGIMPSLAPPIAFAGSGGMMTGGGGQSQTNSNNRSNIFNITATGGTAEQNRQSASQIRREVTLALQHDQQRRK